MIELRNKRALVMGLGVHGGGLGVARFLAEHGAVVTVTDLRGPDLLRASLDALAGLPITFVLGEHRDADFAQAELVVKNPGVPASSRFLQVAQAAGAAIETEMTLFFRLCPGPILGVTGTKGKTTTTALVGAMLREQFPDTVVAGNMRVSALEQLPRIGPNTPVVLELSSFALEDLGAAKLSPQYACYLNLHPDHLDRYTSMEAYAKAKEQIFLHQHKEDVVVLNSRVAAYDYNPLSNGFHAMPAERHVWFIGDADLMEDDGDFQPRQDFTHKDAFIAWMNDDLMWRQWVEHVEPYLSDWQDEVVVTKADVHLVGSHNFVNIAAAAALAKAYGVTNKNIRTAVRNFTGVEHRLECVRELDGVRFINDTAATVPEAAVAALHSYDAPIVLICGGADKRLEFAAFAQAIAARAKAVVLLDGTATPKLAAALQVTVDDRRWTVAPSPSIHGPFADFAQAIRAAHALAGPGEIVLLSPGCASFGMFRNEFHRGEEFRRIVNEL